MPLKSIKVKRWISPKKFENYNISIYDDDSLEEGISRIAFTIQESRFYVWNLNFPNLLFSIDNIKWKDYNPNPLKLKFPLKKEILEPVIYNFSQGNCDFNFLNIIFENDFPDLKDNPYYFTDKIFPSLKELNKTYKKLESLNSIDLSPIIDNKFNIHRFELSSKIKQSYSLADIFTRLNTNKFIQLIQWTNDNFTLLHKLYLYHNISSYNLKKWTSLDKLTDFNCINCYCLLKEENGSFIKITIFKDLSIKINFIIDLRKNISWNLIEETKEKLLKPYLQTTFEEKITFKSISIKVHNYITISNVPLQKLAKNISYYQEIFKTISFKNTINLIYKRSSNYSTELFDLNNYVKNRLLFGVDIDELIEELLTFNKTKEEAKSIINEEIAFLNELEQQNIKPEIIEKKMNTIVVIKTTKFGFEIIIHNIPNKQELDNLLFWISKIISSSQEKDIKKPTKKQIRQKTPSISSSSSSNKSEDEEDLGKISYNTSSSTGGGRLKDNDDQRYRINLLQNADKDLFGENYARGKCQKKNQPFVISPEKREELIKEGTYYVDNDISYGSKKEINNYYICPRFWCKDSKVPANPETKKCPLPNEEIIESYFNNPNEEDVKRYVNLKKPNENDLCIPCCFKKPPKEEELNKCKNYKGYNPEEKLKIIIDEKDKNYLVDKIPVDIGRFGIIPQQLHELLFPDIKYQNCSKDISKEEGCLVRKGILHKLPKDPNIDSIMNALAELLDMDSKKELIKDIKNRLNLFTFLSLENGNVCKAFMDKLPLIPNDNINLIKELQIHLYKYPNINDIYDFDINNFDMKLSRLLAIYKSYKKFINYLETNSYQIPKSPYYLFSLISILYNKLLIIWEKQTKEKLVNIICPYFTSFSDLISSLKDINPDLIMLIKEKKYYEPLEIKYRNKELIKTFKLNQFPNLKELFKECSEKSNDYENYNKIYQNLFSLNTWVNSRVLKNYEKFLINSIIINNDLTIEHFLTKGGFLLTIEKIGVSFLEKLISDLKISKIYFYDDLIDNGIKFNINVYVNDLELFKEKAISYKIKYDIGNLDPDIKQEGTVNQVYTILEFSKKDLDGSQIIHTRIEDDLYIYQNESIEDNKKWFQLQLLVFSTLLKVLTDDKLRELQSLSRIDYINELLKIILKNKNEVFNKINLNKIKIILEEIPIYSINHIKNYLNKINIHYKYDFLNPTINIDEKNNQYIFSQVALNNGIPLELINYHISAPSNDFHNFKFKEFNFKKNKIIKQDSIKLPTIFNGEFHKLESKWIMHKKSIWYNMEILKVNSYNENTFKEFIEWYADFINMNVKYETILEATYSKFKTIRNNETNIKTILTDKIFLKIFSKYTGKKYTNVNAYWDNVYSNLTNNERLELISNIIKNGLPLNDLTILSVAELLNISIITIHRAFYKTTKDSDIRGNIEDLIVSSTLFKAQTNYLNRPLLILYKNKNEFDEISYHLILNKTQDINSHNLFLKLSEVPPEILRLIEEHIKIKNYQ